MNKVAEYRKNAEDCRAMARTMAPTEQRDQLLKMADTWEKLAADRANLIRRYPNTAAEEDRQEQAVRDEWHAMPRPGTALQRESPEHLGYEGTESNRESNIKSNTTGAGTQQDRGD